LIDYIIKTKIVAVFDKKSPIASSINAIFISNSSLLHVAINIPDISTAADREPTAQCEWKSQQ
jgi:hypothetical protein